VLSEHSTHRPMFSRRSCRLAAGGFAVASVLLASCAQMPVGPTAAVMPAPNKPFEVFVQDDQMCRGWAAHSIGLPVNDLAAQQFVGSTVTGAVIGALAGAAVGGHDSAGAGAAVGTLMGSAVGANQSAATGWYSQRSYDIAYQQCMYSKGNVLPGSRQESYPAPPAPPRPPAAAPQR
jgi:uncharacterized protein YcfJ